MNMDIYRGLGLDVPTLHLCVRLLASNGERVLQPLLEELRARLLQHQRDILAWSEEQYSRQAQEAVQRLQRARWLPEEADPAQAEDALLRDFRRLGARIGSEKLLEMQGPALVSCDTISVASADDPLYAAATAGRLWLQAVQGEESASTLYEIWLSFRGALHLDLLNALIEEWPPALRGEPEERSVAPVSQEPRACEACAYRLIYQLGDELLAGGAPEVATQVASVAFAAPVTETRAALRYDVMLLLERLAEQPFLLHASFWQRYAWPAPPGPAFLLRLRLPAGEVPLRQLVAALAAAGWVGRETIMARGMALVGRRLL
jgi:hypothetical protein